LTTGWPDWPNLLDDCLLWAVIWKNTEECTHNFWTTFFHSKRFFNNYEKMVSLNRYALGDFFINSSGHHD
jgi:hypothetical protein